MQKPNDGAQAPSQHDALSEIIAIDSQLPSGCYRRAWSLINSTEGRYLEYVAELAQ